MLAAARRIVEERIPHAGVELLFTPKEEVGLRGAFAFDHTRLEAELGFVYDQAAPIGEIILGAPTQKSIVARFHGRAAHAGMYPEEGRSAIVAAARAIADMRLGRIDDRSSANVGMIEGGVARNIVPEWCTIQRRGALPRPVAVAELVQEMVDAIAFAASTSDCTVETEIEHTYARLHVLARRAGRRACRGGAATRGPRAVDRLLGRRRRRERLQRARACRASTLPTGWSTSTQPTSASRSATSRRWWT